MFTRVAVLIPAMAALAGARIAAKLR